MIVCRIGVCMRVCVVCKNVDVSVRIVDLHRYRNCRFRYGLRQYGTVHRREKHRICGCDGTDEGQICNWR